jgi:GcrA cell cycle regulator
MDPALALEKDEPSLYIFRNGKRDWTPFGVQTILNYYKAKKSMGEIANLCETTRNSVVGVVNRARKRGELPPVSTSPTLGIPKIKTPKLPKNDPESLRVRAMIKAVKEARKQERTRLRLITDKSEVTVLELKFNSCRWPIGDPRLSDFRFCGKMRVAKCSYCPEHKALGSRPSRGRGDY